MECVKFLLANKADASQTTIVGTGMAPLHIALEHGHFEIAKLLADAGPCTHPVMNGAPGRLFSPMDIVVAGQRMRKVPVSRKACAGLSKAESKKVTKCERCGLDATPAAVSRLKQVWDRLENPPPALELSIELT